MTVVSVIGEGGAHVQDVTEERGSDRLNKTAKQRQTKIHLQGLHIWKGEHSKQSIL